jgi:hypothetical protein
VSLTQIPMKDLAMTIIVNQTCPSCGYENRQQSDYCGLCGELLDSACTSGLPSNASPKGDTHLPFPCPRDTGPQRASSHHFLEAESSLTPWLYLGAGFLIAQVFHISGILGFMGWFLCALPHEMGHSLFACYVGMPAYPAISLSGHAAAFHQPQAFPLALLIWASLAACAFALRKRPVARVFLALAVLSYPLLAFSQIPRELMHLLGGHLAELAFATVCFWRTLSGGFSKSKTERTLYAILGWHILGTNLWLTFGLMTDSAARAHYSGNGSFGLSNDYIRVAEDLLSWSLPSVAGLMFVLGLLVLPLSILIWRLRPELQKNA